MLNTVTSSGCSPPRVLRALRWKQPLWCIWIDCWLRQGISRKQCTKDLRLFLMLATISTLSLEQLIWNTRSQSPHTKQSNRHDWNTLEPSRPQRLSRQWIYATCMFHVYYEAYASSQNNMAAQIIRCSFGAREDALAGPQEWSADQSEIWSLRCTEAQCHWGNCWILVVRSCMHSCKHAEACDGKGLC